MKIYLKQKVFAIGDKYDFTDAQGNACALEGDFGAYQFQLSYSGKTFGSVRKKLFSFGDAYELDVADGYDPALFCAIAVIIDQCLHNQKNR